NGAGAQRGQIGAGARLGEALAPDLVGGEDALEVPALVLLRAVRDQHRPTHGEACQVDRHGRLGTRHLLLEDDLLEWLRRAAAVLRGRRKPAPARPVALFRPGLAVGDQVVEPLRLGSCRVLLQPRPQLGAEALLVGGVGEIHRGKSSGATFCQNHASPGVSSTSSTVRSILVSALSLAISSRCWAIASDLPYACTRPTRRPPHA